MKRAGNLKKNWCNYDALFNAFKEVKKNKSYYHNVLEFESNLVCNLNRILESLEDNTYQVKPTRDFYIYDPKTRLIQAPHIEDRIVQHAVLNSVREIIEKKFIDQSFACRKNKGTHKSNDLLKKYLLNYKGVDYYLKIDIRKFFYRIDHKILNRQLANIIKCKPTLEILKKFYTNELGKGLPLGNVTSQVLANLALNPVDHFIKRKLFFRHYIRYMDDLIILHTDKSILRKALIFIKRVLQALKLETNQKTQIGQIADGIDFVGFKTWFNFRLIRKRSLYKIKRVLKKHPDMNRVASYLSHSMRTNSLAYVVQQIIKVAPSFIMFVKKFLYNNKKYEVYNEIFCK